jgi:hypothetical protein
VAEHLPSSMKSSYISGFKEDSWIFIICIQLAVTYYSGFHKLTYWLVGKYCISLRYNLL